MKLWLAACYLGTVLCDVVPYEPGDLDHGELHGESPASLLRARPSAILAVVLVVAATAMILLSVLGFTRKRELVDLLE